MALLLFLYSLHSLGNYFQFYMIYDFKAQNLSQFNTVQTTYVQVTVIYILIVSTRYNCLHPIEHGTNNMKLGVWSLDDLPTHFCV